MRVHILPSVIGVVLASSIGLASAADTAATKGSTVPPAAQSVAKDSLKLTSMQEETAWNDISKEATKQTAPSGFTASVGAVVPSGITLRPVSSTLAGQVPTLKAYEYALLQDKLLIVNPTDKKIVDVINHKTRSSLVESDAPAGQAFARRRLVVGDAARALTLRRGNQPRLCCGARP